MMSSCTKIRGQQCLRVPLQPMMPIPHQLRQCARFAQAAACAPKETAPAENNSRSSDQLQRVQRDSRRKAVKAHGSSCRDSGESGVGFTRVTAHQGMAHALREMAWNHYCLLGVSDDFLRLGVRRSTVFSWLSACHLPQLPFCSCLACSQGDAMSEPCLARKKPFQC
eukprot:6477127-Amphidinium_carterae.1